MPMNVQPVPILDERTDHTRMRTVATVDGWSVSNEAKLWISS